MKLNLACGSHKREGHVNIDQWESTKPDKVLDLLSPDWWKEFGENSVDEAYCGHFVEHIPHGTGSVDLFFVFMDNLYKVMKDKGTVEMVWPHHRHLVAYIEPTHHRVITQLTWRYTDATWRRDAEMDYYPVECDFSFEIREMKSATPQIITEMKGVLNSFAVSHFWNVIEEEHGLLTAHKPARQDAKYTGP